MISVGLEFCLLFRYHGASTWVITGRCGKKGLKKFGPFPSQMNKKEETALTLWVPRTEECDIRILGFDPSRLSLNKCRTFTSSSEAG